MLTIHHLHKAFGLNPILKDITFAVNNGDRVGLIGPNGCGKSSLLRLVAGQEKADGGVIQLAPHCQKGNEEGEITPEKAGAVFSSTRPRGKALPKLTDEAGFK